MLPGEILQKIFSYISYWEIYRMRSICKSWKVQCEYHVYLLLKSRGQKLFIKIGEKGKTSLIDMLPYNYDSENQVIEFRSSSSSDDISDQEEAEDDVYMNPTSSRRTQIFFSEWSERSIANLGFAQDLSLTDRALVMFHLKYNHSLEQVYQIPVPSNDKSTSGKLQYIGDRGMVMSFSYIYPTQDGIAARAIQFRGVEDSVSTSVFDDVQAADPSPIRLRVHAVYVNFSWLLSGLNPDISAQPIYTSRYQALTDLLDKEGIKNYSPYSESVLEYIMADHYHQSDHRLIPSNEQDKKTVILLQNENEESKSEQLQSKLQSAGIDPRVIWKYTFAKNFILKDQNNVRSDDVAKVIQKSEEDWVIKKLELLRQLKR